MLNRYPLWKYLLILVIVGLGFLYAAPNLYAPDPAVQISGTSSTSVVTERTLKKITRALAAKNIEYFDETLNDKTALIRLRSKDQQNSAKTAIKDALGDDYIVALNLASTTPSWMASAGAQPMKLGLDLSGGVHFLMEVDTASVISTRMKSFVSELKSQLREAGARYKSVEIDKDLVLVAHFETEAARTKASGLLRSQFQQLQKVGEEESAGVFSLRAAMTEQAVDELEDYAVGQNLGTLRNRVNELGVSEPIVQRQGSNRIVVELPGVQDTSEAKRIIGKTANLEFRLEARDGSPLRERFDYRNSEQQLRTGGAFLERAVVIKGDRVAGAQSSFDENGLPQVNINLDSKGGTQMHRATRGENIGRRLGVLFIEYKTRTRNSRGEVLEKPIQLIERKIISLATIQSALGVQFRITGLDDPAEASELALLLRSGALAAPMHFVQESTIGPSLGADNIRLGVKSVQLGLLLVLVFMLFYYRVFGFAANVALAVNLVLLIAFMSLLGATLTLPGIAGIVLTVGMAVDANVLIFSRIKEELANGLPTQSAIDSGFNRAFTTILDANITTFIVAIILYAVGTGPVQGFAVTLAIGILTSMFTAIVGTRAMINLIYGGRTVNKLWI